LKYLLDSCTLLWFAQNNDQMSETAFSAIEDLASETHVSAISFWELSMKSVVGKLNLEWNPSNLETLTLESGIGVLPLTVAHVDRFHQVPTDHRDAFDRLIAAIALLHDYTLITPDPAFNALGVKRIW
jgi:PIN domain nuclease of toxin-antitoxin system